MSDMIPKHDRVGGNPAVVIGIATHNRADLLRKAISSALSQSYRPRRVAVIDDSSTDATLTVRDEFPAVRWERWENRLGQIKARNRMMLSASDDYYVSLDDDAWFLEGDEIAIAIDFMESHPSVAAVAFDILDKDRKNKSRRGINRSIRTFIGCGHVLRLSVVKRLGGYAELPGAGWGEERELCLRIIDAGYEIVGLSGVHVWHDYSFVGRNLDRQYRDGVWNDLAVVLLRAPLMIVLPALTARVLQQYLVARRIKCGHMYLKCAVELIPAIPALWRGRRPVRLSTIARYQALPAH